jgi:hypothetical protein
MFLNKRQLATILAGLRQWQIELGEMSDDDRADVLDGPMSIATDGGTLCPLTPGEIERLCDMLNE